MRYENDRISCKICHCEACSWFQWNPNDNITSGGLGVVHGTTQHSSKCCLLEEASAILGDIGVLRIREVRDAEKSRTRGDALYLLVTDY